VPLVSLTLCLVILESRIDDMSKGIRFTDEFKLNVVAQVFERGYAFSEVAEGLGISTKSLYT
jgi:transposase-like protein